MDDLLVTNTSVPGWSAGLGWALNQLNLDPWSWREGKQWTSFTSLWMVWWYLYLPITYKPVTSLGKVFNCSLKDTASIQTTIKKLEVCSGQVRSPWQIQGVVTPTQHSALPLRKRTSLYKDGWACYIVLLVQSCMTRAINSSFLSAAWRRNSEFLMQ